MSEEVERFYSIDPDEYAVRVRGCPKCGAKKGDPCMVNSYKTPRPRREIHPERRRQAPPADVKAVMDFDQAEDEKMRAWLRDNHGIFRA